MEALPEELWREPQPVLAVQGELDWDPDIHERLIRSLHTVSLDHQQSGNHPLGGGTTIGNLGSNTVPFRFLSVPKLATFPPKKPSSIDDLKASDGRPLEGYTVRGILKSYWMHKHVMEIPSVAILLGAADMAWSILEWAGRETMLIEALDRLRAQLGPRDVKVFLILIRRGFGDEREFDERVMNLRRRANLDTKMLYILNDPQDLLPTALAMRRLYKHVRDVSSTFYLNNCKRVKRWEGSLNRASQLSLIIRYRFKQAFWYEFLGNVEKALKHYRRAFESLVEMHNVIVSHTGGERSLSISGSGSGSYQLSTSQLLGGWIAQVKAVAEYVSFKVCYYSMREALHADAVTQFRQLMQHWLQWPRGSYAASSAGSSYTTNSSSTGTGSISDLISFNNDDISVQPPTHRLDFLHFEWVARQYQLFGDLLQRFPSPHLTAFGVMVGTDGNATAGGGGGSGGVDITDAYADPDHYMFNASLYTAKRGTVAKYLLQNRRPDSKFAARLGVIPGGQLLRLPYFVGGRPELADPGLQNDMTDADVAELIQLILEKGEVQIPHAQVLIGLLKDTVAYYDPSRTARPRFKALQHLQLANQLAKAQAYGEAWQHYGATLRKYDLEREGGWNDSTVLVMFRARYCAYMLGKQAEYLDLTFKLLSHELRSALPLTCRQMLFFEALYILSGLPDIPDHPLVKQQASSLGGFFGSSTYGQYASQLPPPSSQSTTPSYDRLDSSSTTSTSAMDPMVTILPHIIEVNLGCSFRHLVSLTVTSIDPTAAMGQACVLNLRLISHLPAMLHLTSLELRFNKEYIGTIILLDDQPLSAADRLRQSFLTGGGSDGSQQLQGKQQKQQLPPLQIHETKVARTRLVLEPDVPLDLLLSILIPTHELVEVGDMLYALQVKLNVDMPPDEASSSHRSYPLGSSAAVPYARPLCFNLLSGVIYLESLGIVAADICEEGVPPDYIVSSQPATLPVPLEASVRGFPAVEITRPVARATVGLEDGNEDSIVTTLVQHMCCIWLKVQSHEDALSMPMLYVRNDPPPASHRPEDALFFQVNPEEGTHVPIKLGKDLQPEAALRVLGGGGSSNNTTSPTEIGQDLLAHNQEVWLPIWLRTTREGHTKINIVLVYHSVEGDGKNISRSPSSDIDQYSNLMVSSEFTFDLESYAGFQTNFEVASPIPLPVPPPQTPNSSTTSLGTAAATHAFFTGDEVVMRVSIKATSPPEFIDGIPLIEQVIWYPSDTSSNSSSSSAAPSAAMIPALSPREISQPHALLGPSTKATSSSGRVIYLPPSFSSAEEGQKKKAASFLASSSSPTAAAAGAGMLLHEVLTLTFHFLCPEKESSHPINLGHIRIYWKITPPPSSSPASSLSVIADRYHRLGSPWTPPTKEWLACNDIACPSINVIKPHLAVDLQAPTEAKLDQGFPLHWSIKNLVNHIVQLRVLIIDDIGGPGQGAADEYLVWGGMRESIVQILPHTSLLIPYEVVPLSTGPLALPRLNLTILPTSSAEQQGEASPTEALPAIYRISHRYLENAAAAPPPSSAGGGGGIEAAVNAGSVRHVFVLPPDASVGK